MEACTLLVDVAGMEQPGHLSASNAGYHLIKAGLCVPSQTGQQYPLHLSKAYNYDECFSTYQGRIGLKCMPSS